MPRLFTRQLMLIWLLLATSSTSLACSCAGLPLDKRYELSENIFIATITEGQVNSDYRVFVGFIVNERFKGDIPFDTLRTHLGGASCGTSFRVGVKYLIFAPDSGEVGLCSGLAAIDTDTNSRVNRNVTALREFVTGDSPTLTVRSNSPLEEQQCVLANQFNVENRSELAFIVFFYWTRPESPAGPDARIDGTSSVSAAVSIIILPNEELSDSQIVLETASRTYTANWRELEEQDGGGDSHFELLGKEALHLIREIPTLDNLVVRGVNQSTESLRTLVRQKSMANGNEEFFGCMDELNAVL